MNIHCNETLDTNSNEVIFCLVNSFINVFEDIQTNKLKRINVVETLSNLKTLLKPYHNNA